MAATTSVTYTGVWGDVKAAIVEVTLDTSYPTGGEAIDFVAVLDWYSVIIVLPVTSSGGIVPNWDASGALMMAFYDTNPAAGGGANTEFVQATSTDNLSAQTITCLVIGK